MTATPQTQRHDKSRIHRTLYPTTSNFQPTPVYPKPKATSNSKGLDIFSANLLLIWELPTNVATSNANTPGRATAPTPTTVHLALAAGRRAPQPQLHIAFRLQKRARRLGPLASPATTRVTSCGVSSSSSSLPASREFFFCFPRQGNGRGAATCPRAAPAKWHACIPLHRGGGLLGCWQES